MTTMQDELLSKHGRAIACIDEMLGENKSGAIATSVGEMGSYVLQTHNSVLHSLEVLKDMGFIDYEQGYNNCDHYSLRVIPTENFERIAGLIRQMK